MADGERKTEVVSAWPEPIAEPVAGPSPGRDTSDGELSHDGVHLLRTTQQIQYQLSQMADQKASMLLGITFVIFTLAVGEARNGAPPLPILILAVGAFVAAVLTVLAVLPSVTGQTFGPGAQPNILFFGVFSKMSETEFIETLMARASDNRAVQETFARDIYQNGRVLAGKKYRLLGWAYRVLLVGLFASGAAFVTPLAAKALGL